MEPTQQYHGILIRVLLQSDKERPDVQLRLTWRGKPTRGWPFRAILCKQSQFHQCQSFVIISSTPNRELNDDLLAVIRLCLGQVAAVPNHIWVESTNQGYLRLVLEESLDWKAETPHPAILFRQASNGDQKHTRHSEPGSLAEMYDVYQDLRTTVPVIPEFWVPKGPEIPRSARNSECLMVARGWLQTCQREHPQCRVHGMQELPTRVLDVSGESVRLHIPMRGTQGSWVALSYCWGTEMLLRTMNDNVESHKMGIAWPSLPKTHQDAVTITRALGLQYLWIDSLCIIQDDDGVDFHAEAAKMCDVYRHSSLTISAACSISGCQGFLWDRAHSESFAPSPREAGRFQSLRCRQAIDHRRMISEEPIHSRAWTFQETILPPRLLSFCSREMTWECETLKQCECWRIHEQSDSGETYDDMGRAAYRRFTKSIMLDGCSSESIIDVQQSHAQIERSNPNGQEEFLRQVEQAGNKELLIQFFSTTKPAGRNLGAYNRYLRSLTRARRDRVTSLRRRAERARLESWQYIPGQSIFSQYSTAFELDEPENVLQDAIDEAKERNNIQLFIANNEDLRMYGTHRQKKHDFQPELEAFYRYWRHILVPEYTRRRISKDEDRLIALQAIAGDIQSRIRDQYCAGLWRKDLIRQLCWKSQTDKNTPASNQSPSWSWSSIRGPIIPCLNTHVEGTNPNATETPGNLEVDEITCNALNSNPCGQLLGGCIKLYAWALDVEAVRNRVSGRIEFFRRNECILVPIIPRLKFFPDTPLVCKKEQPLTRSRHREFHFGRERDNEWEIDYEPDVHDELPERGAQAILLLVLENKMCVLVCSPTSETKVVRRVGIGLYRSQDNLDMHSLGWHFTAGMTLRHLELT